MPAPQDLQQARMAICESCPELTTLNRCQQCGCFMTLKTRLIGAHCPLGKWPLYEQWTTQNSNENLVK
jgi:hypothetical protein